MQANSAAKPKKKQSDDKKCAECAKKDNCEHCMDDKKCAECAKKDNCEHCMGVSDGNGGTKKSDGCVGNRQVGVRCICCKRLGDADRQRNSRKSKGKCPIAPAAIDVVSAVPIEGDWQQVDSTTDQHSPPSASEDCVTATAVADEFGPNAIVVVSAVPIEGNWQQVDSITDQHSPPSASEYCVTATAVADEFGPDLRSLVEHANSLVHRCRSAESDTVTQGRLLSLQARVQALADYLRACVPVNPLDRRELQACTLSESTSGAVQCGLHVEAQSVAAPGYDDRLVDGSFVEVSHDTAPPLGDPVSESSTPPSLPSHHADELRTPTMETDLLPTGRDGTHSPASFDLVDDLLSRKISDLSVHGEDDEAHDAKKRSREDRSQPRWDVTQIVKDIGKFDKDHQYMMNSTWPHSIDKLDLTDNRRCTASYEYVQLTSLCSPSESGCLFDGYMWTEGKRRMSAKFTDAMLQFINSSCAHCHTHGWSPHHD
jgi:ribosomal protein S15P/S13E